MPINLTKKVNICECSFDSKFCKRKVEFWAKKESKYDDPLPNWWYGLCKYHLDILLKENGIEISELQYQAQRERKYKKRKLINWKMFLDWEELGYHSKIKVYDEEAYGDIRITMALKNHRKNNLKKYKKKIGINH